MNESDRRGLVAFLLVVSMLGGWLAAGWALFTTRPETIFGLVVWGVAILGWGLASTLMMGGGHEDNDG